jgi:hypothetical protein
VARAANPLSPPSVRRSSAVADLDHTLATATVVLGVVGLLLVAVDLATAGTLFGVVGMGVGLWAQMISRTRGERWVDMVGLLLSFLAVAFGAADGGL